MNKATVVKVDGSIQELDHRPSLKEAQQIVGGWIELVKVCQYDNVGYPKRRSGAVLVVDEDGQGKNKPVNKVITDRYGSSIYGGYIVGDVILLEGWRTVGC